MLKLNTLLSPVEFISLFKGNHTFVSKLERMDENTTEVEIVPWHYCKEDINEIGAKLLSQNGAPKYRGIYFTVNEIDQDLDKGLNAKGYPRKRTKKMLKAIRAVFCDDDESGEYRDDFPITPNIVLQSSPNKFQYFWLTTTDNFREWDGVQNTIVEQFAGDKNAKDRVRILRIPGFNHNKGEPFMVKAFATRVEAYSWSEIVAAFPPSEWKPSVEISGSGFPRVTNSKHVSSERLMEILKSGEHIHGPCSRTAQSLANFGKDAEYIWDWIYPVLDESKACDPEHDRHSDWMLKIQGGLQNDIDTAITKYKCEKR